MRSGRVVELAGQADEFGSQTAKWRAADCAGQLSYDQTELARCVSSRLVAGIGRRPLEEKVRPVVERRCAGDSQPFALGAGGKSGI